MADPLVLHCDLDAFFVQVEQQRNPSLRGKAIAIQQHQDIIATNYLARQAGVAKHQSSHTARRLLAKVGGLNVHVHCEPGGRVSYRPYQQASNRFFKFLRALPWVAVVEKASIDEAFLLVDAGLGNVSGVLHTEQDKATAVFAVATQLRDRLREELDLVASVGIGSNRLMAKLASRAAKPPSNGIHLALSSIQVDQLLQNTRPERLPGFGGKMSQSFEALGVSNVLELRRHSVAQLASALGPSSHAVAEKLSAWSRGDDPTPVVDRGPAQSLSVAMTLTQVELRMHPSWGSVSASGGAKGKLQPLVVGAQDFEERMKRLMVAMGGDLVERVVDHYRDENRWPAKLALHVRAMGAGKDASYTQRSCTFPAKSMNQNEQQQQQQQQQQHGKVLVEATLRGLQRLVATATAAYPRGAKVVELRVVASQFGAVDRGMAPLSKFFESATETRDQDAAATNAVQDGERLEGVASGDGDGVSDGNEQPRKSLEAPCPGVEGRQAKAEEGGCEALQTGTQSVENAAAIDVDLTTIDVAEQRRLLRDVQVRVKGRRRPLGAQGESPRQAKIARYFSSIK
jgi:nucleotidyltransferase/DNA polymerase involved in DNA repair